MENEEAALIYRGILLAMEVIGRVGKRLVCSV